MKKELIQKYNMQPHPEGGFYVETFRSTTNVNTEKGARSASCSITVVELTEDGGYKTTILGSNIAGPNANEVVQYVVKGGTWFGSFPNIEQGSDDCSFVGCTVSPGFEFSDFEMGSNALLSKAYPIAAASGIIDKMTVGLP